MQQRSLIETWRHLESLELEMPWDETGNPFVPSKMPSFDDDLPFGRRFFRMRLEAADFGNLQLPRTFFGRSEFEGVSFRNTDLSESRMCWNDFIGCDFTNANLTGCDMRASRWIDCNFTGATMARADLRCSFYEECNFENAVMVDAISDSSSAQDQERGLLESLSDTQRESMDWHEEPGEEPGGG